VGGANLKHTELTCSFVTAAIAATVCLSMPLGGDANLTKPNGKVPDFNLTEKDSGKPIKVPVGARVNICLQENPTTGYRWSLRDFKSESLALESDEYESAPASGIGGGGIRHFLFVAKTAGTTTIILKNMRAWEPEEEAPKTFSLVITVE
jgi:inhibitor of cysteine peptidase